MAKRRRIRWDRILLVFGPILLLIILCVKCHHGDEEDPGNPDPGTVDSMTVSESGQDSEAVPVQSAYRDLVVVVDAGHGGNDNGICLYNMQ